MKFFIDSDSEIMKSHFRHGLLKNHATSSFLLKSNDIIFTDLKMSIKKRNQTGVQILQITKPTDEGSEQCLNRQVYL